MASIAVDTTADTSAATSAVRSPLAFDPPPVPPTRSFYKRNTDIEKLFFRGSVSKNTINSVAMASKIESSMITCSQPENPSALPPPPPPGDFQAIASPLPPDLPPPPDFYRTSSLSPPPPPPPPSYLFPELSCDLPLPPPPQLLMSLDPQALPLYVCSYDPPSPEIKSEYDPKLPPGFPSESVQNPLSPPPPPVPPPPRPTPPPPPTPPVRQASRENINIPQAHSTAVDDDTESVRSLTYTKASSDLYLASAEETQTKDSDDGASSNYPAKHISDSHTATDSIDGRPFSSELSSSTQTATLLLTPESGLSPLPPHALRVSPVPTDANTITSSQTDDLTTTSASSDATSTPNIFDSRDTTFDIDTPEVTPQLSEILGTHSPTPNEVKMNSVMDEILAEIGSGSEVTPHLSEISGSHSVTPTEEKIESVDVEVLDGKEVNESQNQGSSLVKLLESSTASPPDSSESERIDDNTGNDSISESTDYSLTEKITASSLAANSNTEGAQMSSPFSTEPPSLFSLPTDSDTISADMDSLAADMLSPMGDLESYPADVDTSTVNSIATTEAADMFFTSSSGYSDTAYATGDSNLESAIMSPAFTESCTITPIPADYVTPLSTHPTTTPVPSPVPSSPLPYFDAISLDNTHYAQSHTSHASSAAVPSVITSAPRMFVSSSEHRNESHMKTTSAQKRLVSSQVSQCALDLDDKNISQKTDRHPHELIHNAKFKETLKSSIDVVKLGEKLRSEERKQNIQKIQNADVAPSETEYGSTEKTNTCTEENLDAQIQENTEENLVAQIQENTEPSEKVDANSMEGDMNETKEPAKEHNALLSQCKTEQTLSTDSSLQVEESPKADVKVEKLEQLDKVINASNFVDKIEMIKQDESGSFKSDKPDEPLKINEESEQDNCKSNMGPPEVSEMKEQKIPTEVDKCFTLMSTQTSNTSSDNHSEVSLQDSCKNKELDITHDENEKILIETEIPKNEEITDKEKINTGSNTDEDNKCEINESKESSLSQIFVFDFCGDDQSVSDTGHKSPPPSPTLPKLDSISLHTCNSPQLSMHSRLSPFGGSMSPKLPLSPAKSPVSFLKETDVTARRSPSHIPLSKSPEEAMELLDTLVGNMETLSADLPPSPIVKETLEETGIVTVPANNENGKLLECDPLVFNQQKSNDTGTSFIRNEENDVDQTLSLSNETNGAVTESVSSCKPFTSSDSHNENIPCTSSHPSPTSSDLKRDSQCNYENNSTAAPQHTTRVDSSNGIECNVLNSCELSNNELIAANDSQDLHATNTEFRENAVGDISNEPNEVVDDADNHVAMQMQNEIIQENDVETLALNNSDTLESSEGKEVDYTNYPNNLCSQKDSLNDTFDIEETVTGNASTTSFSSPSLHSIVEDVVSPSPASRAKTPPLPPPRSCINTPKPGGTGAPLPPPRQYMLIPINSSQVPSRRHSPPPAPPRSTSVRRSPPPPPPRSAVQTPSAKNDWIEFPPLPPPPISSINTPSTPPKLTPVPEESSFPTTPLPSRESESESSSARSNTPHNKKSPYEQGVSEKKVNIKSEEPPTHSDLLSLSPPALPPSPEEDREEEPPPPPPPPIDYREEDFILHSLSPTQDFAICPPPPPARIRLPTPPLSVSQGELSQNNPLSSLDSQTNNSSILPASGMDSKNAAATTPQETDEQSASVIPAPVAPPPPPPKPLSHVTLPSSAQVPSHSLPSAPPPPRCPVPQSPKSVPNSALWTVSPYGKVVINRNDLPLPPPEEEVRKTFHNVKNWGLLDYSTDTLAVYTQLRPNIQMGPQCGLVALSTASQVFPETKEVADLLKDAKEQNFTSHGEMFSSENMAKLANGINGMEAAVRRDVLCDPKKLLDLLIHGNLILAPYDADQNHMPTFRNGHKAHWGIICGCLVQCSSLNMNMGGASKLDTRMDNLFHIRPRSRRGFAPSREGSVTPSTPLVPGSPRLGHRILRTPEGPSTLTHDSMKTPDPSFKESSVGRTCESDNWSVCSSRVNTPMLPDMLHDDIRMVVLWRQGKGRNLIAAPIEKLCESNDQLFEYPAPSNEIENEFIIDSVRDGLAGQVVVLHKTKTALSDLVGILQDKQENK